MTERPLSETTRDAIRKIVGSTVGFDTDEDGTCVVIGIDSQKMRRCRWAEGFDWEDCLAKIAATTA